MKALIHFILRRLFFIWMTCDAFAATRYVDVNSANPTPPYTNWASAANIIQDAIDIASTGDEVVVTNGIYASGGRRIYGTMTNRVAVDKPLRLRSVNGPQFTVIQGHQVPGSVTGDCAVRCVYLSSGASVSGFTLTNGATRWCEASASEMHGGGVWCEAMSALVSNCVVTGNAACGDGGGAYGGTLVNCDLTGNSGWEGGGACLSTLRDCTLTGNSAGFSGGGANSCTLIRCKLSGNSTPWTGGGASSGTLNGCAITGNSARHGGGICDATASNCAITGNTAEERGGGAASSTLNNCTLTGNLAWSGGGAQGSVLNNCIAYFNWAAIAPNWQDAALNFCCTTPLPTAGVGNLDVDPQLASASHLSGGSPCIGAGSAAFALGSDLDGELWTAPPSIGCDESRAGAAAGTLSVAISTPFTSVVAGFPVELAALIEGRTTASVWQFEDGTVASNRPFVMQAWARPGDHEVTLLAYNESNPGGLVTSATIHLWAQPVHYVAAGSTNPLPPYDSWATASATIQDAADAVAVAGALVLVADGVYATGGRAVSGTLTNRVAVRVPAEVRSVNGPRSAVIQGYQVPGSTNGDGAVRCVYLTNGASLSGFTLSRGATHQYTLDVREQAGGGVWCEPGSASVSNCVLQGNAAGEQGGGAYRASLVNCLLTRNSANAGGGAAFSALSNCTVVGNSAGSGAGAYSSTLNQCSLSTNSASLAGGGASYGTLNQCVLTGNSADEGGGVCDATLTSCILVGNSALYGGGGCRSGMNNCVLLCNSGYYYGGGVFYGTLKNCTLTGNQAVQYHGGGSYLGTLRDSIVYGNSAPGGANYLNGVLTYCCTAPLPGGVGNITNAPLFVASSSGNPRLQTNSPCINAGVNAFATNALDLDGNPRIVGGTVDIGAYEFQSPASALSYAWLRQFGLPSDGSADFADSDLDGHNNWQEWRADTSPTNALSRLALLVPTNGASGLSVTWESVATRSYFLERGTNVSGPPPIFAPLATNLAGRSGTTTFTDTTATNGGPFFYRVGVQP